jgi:hypothetical protein
MLNCNQDLDNPAAADPPHLAADPLMATPPEGGLAPGRFLATLSPAITSWRRCARQEDSRVIIRFQNGYGAIISEHRRPAGMYEVAPLRFHGCNPDDYGFYFGSHVPDLTWCSTVDEIVSLCEEISRLAPPRLT